MENGGRKTEDRCQMPEKGLQLTDGREPTTDSVSSVTSVISVACGLCGEIL